LFVMFDNDSLSPLPYFTKISTHILLPSPQKGGLKHVIDSSCHGKFEQNP